MSNKRIVLIGGGSGVSALVRKICEQQFCEELTVLVPISDAGGSSGILRERLGIPAVGDLRQNFSASISLTWAKIFEKRQGQHPLGNLILAFWLKKFGLNQALANYAELLQTKVRVLPSAQTPSTLIGKFGEQGVLCGEQNFEHPAQQFCRERDCQVTLKPQPKMQPAAAAALKSATKIIVGPGSFFGSLVVHFLVQDFARIFRQAPAQKILIRNCTQHFAAEQDYARFLPVKFTQVFEPPAKKLRWPSEVLVKLIRA